jgi:hypothetical protein
VTGSPGTTLDFDGVDSTNSTDDGINLGGLANGTFNARSGTIGGAMGIAVDVDGGNGSIMYPGALNNGPGQTADITNRTGGSVTFSGPIADSADTGGGITLSGNSGGSTTFSNASKAINTGSGEAVAMVSSDGHALTFSGGGLNIDTTSGAGINAANSGTLTVTGTNNTIDTTTGTAINVNNTNIGGGASGTTFKSVSSNGAPSGIVLNNTGAAARLSVTGNLGACTSAATFTGGAIQNSTGAGIIMTSVGGGARLERMSVHNGGDDGIRAMTVGNGIELYVRRLVSNGNADFERGLDYTNVTGISAIGSATVTDSAATNARIANDTAGTNTMIISGSTFSNNSTTLGAHGLEIRGNGTSTINATAYGSTFSANRDTGFKLSNGSGSPTMNLDFWNNTVTGGNLGALSAQSGISISTTSGAQTKVKIDDNEVRGRWAPQ